MTKVALNRLERRQLHRNEQRRSLGKTPSQSGNYIREERVDRAN